MTFDQFLTHYEVRSGYKSKRIGSKDYQIRCVAHEDNTASLTIGKGDNDNVVIHCHAGCDYESILDIVGLEPSDLFENQSREPYKVLKVFEYYDADGTYLFQVERSNHFPKGIPVRIGEDGEKIWGINSGDYYKSDIGWRKPKKAKDRVGECRKIEASKRVLYNLPELVSKNHDLVVIVGGEKDADNLMEYGIMSTTNPLGEGKWSKDFNKYFEGMNVVIIPDNDGPGRDHAQFIYNGIKNIAASARVLDLGLTEKGEDFSDYIEYHSLESFLDLLYGVKLPNARITEEYVLGAVFRSNNLVGELIQYNAFDKFFVWANRQIAGAMLECFEDGLTIDKITVGEVLGIEKLLKCGGYGYLEEILAKAEQPDSVVSHLKLIDDKYEARQLVQASKIIGDQALTTKDPRKLKSQFMERLTPREDQQDTMVVAGDYAPEFLKNFGDRVPGIKTGFTDLDAVTGGFRPTNLVIVGARPGMGKTIIGLNMAESFAESGNKVLFCSLEMDRDEVLTRSLAGKAFVPLNSFNRHQFTRDEILRLDRAKDKISKNLMIDDLSSLTIPILRSKIITLTLQGKAPKVIVVDYLQRMSSNRVSRREEVAEIARGLKTLAKEFRVLVIALAQLTRYEGELQGIRPALRNLKESGDIEQEADVVAFLYREDYYNLGDERTGIAELILRKGRNVPKTTVYLAFLGAYGKFLGLSKVDNTYRL